MKTLLIICFILLITQLFSTEKVNENFSLEIPDSTQVQILYTEDGSTYTGRITEIGIEEIKFETKHGILTFPIIEIKDIKLISELELKKGKYWFPNPNVTRLFFAPTARMLKKGEGYFADYFILFPTVVFGVTDNITLGGGMSLIPGIDLDKQIFIFTPKVGIKTSKKMDLAIGALILQPPNDIPALGILYGVSTVGTLDQSFTLGLGYYFAEDELADKPMAVLGGEIRTSRSISLVSENWIVPETYIPILSLGLRFFGEKLSADFALFCPMDEEATILPYIDFVYKF